MTTCEKWLNKLQGDLQAADEILIDLSQLRIGSDLYANLPEDFRRELRTLQATHAYMIKDLGEIMTLGDERRSRKIRALIPIVGDGLSWLFGTATKKDVREIKRNLKIIATNQNEQQ